MKQKIIVIIIIMMFSIISILHTDNNVKAAEATYSYSFEGTDLTKLVACGDKSDTDNLEAFFNSTHKDGTVEVRNTQHHTGTKSYYVAKNSGTYLHIDRCLGRVEDILTNFSIWFYTSTGQNFVISGINKTSSNNIFYIVVSSDDLHYYDYLGVSKDVTTTNHVDLNAWNKITLEYITNENMSYYLTDSTGVSIGTYGTPRTIQTGNYTVDRILIDASGSNDHNYFDDITAQYDIEFSGGGGGYNSLAGYIGIGSACCGGDISFTAGVNKNIETEFYVPMTCTIRAVDLSFEVPSSIDNTYMALYGITLAEYEQSKTTLYVNGFSQGNPDEIIDASLCTIYRWYTNVELTNEEPVFEYYNQDSWGFNNMQIMLSSIDVNGDGQKGFYIHNSDAYKGTGIVEAITVWTHDYDLCMKFYITQSSEQNQEAKPNATWLDGLSTSGESYAGIHPLYNIKTYFNYTTVFITYGISTLSYTTSPNQLWIYDDDGNPCSQTQGFSPMELTSYDGAVGFVPYNTGNYTIRILRDGLEVAKTVIYVYNNPDKSYYIYSIPNPSDLYEPYTVFYKESSAKDVYLALFIHSYSFEADNPDINNFEEATLTYSVSGSGYISYNSFTPVNGIHYWRLFAKINQYTYEALGSTHKHYISNNQVGNDIKVRYTPLELGLDSLATQIFEYNHNYPGGTVAVFLNGENIRYVGESAQGLFSHTITHAGYYTVELMVLLNDTWYLLDSCTFIAVIEGAIPDDTSIFVLPLLTQPLGSILGLIFVFVCLFLPVIVVMAFSKESGSRIIMEIPTFVYGITGGLGIGVAVLMGCFPGWLVFFVIAVGIIVVAISYLVTHGGFTMGSGGNGGD